MPHLTFADTFQQSIFKRILLVWQWWVNLDHESISYTETQVNTSIE